MNAKQWIAEICAAKKREKDWRKEGEKILEIYGGKKPVPFNILFSNTETMLPSLYSAVPRPVVNRRFKDDDQLGKQAAEAGRRGLEFLLDTNVDGYETYDEAMRAAVLDALLPGRGVTSIKYDAEIANNEVEEKEAAEDEALEDSPVAYKASELVCCESRKWDRFLHGYATKWSKVPWVAFGEDIDRAEATRLFGRKKAAKLQYSADRDPDDEKNPDDENKGETKVTPIWIVWHKDSRKVLFLSEFYADEFLKVEDDPLQLTGFFPIPKPIMLVEKANDLSVTAIYDLYKVQAEELNSLSRRIIKIVHAIKARGLYDGELSADIENLMEADDNALVPAQKNASLAAEKGLQNAIWFMPLDMLVNTLRELMVARESCKAVIWEIMGIADIMRGQSAASETLGAQEIKQAWGSLRLKRMQKEVQRYARDLLRMMLEVAANKFSEDTWAAMTGLPFLTESQFAQAQAQMQAIQQQMMFMPPPMPPMPGQPPPPQDPQRQQIEQAMQQAQAELQKPKWADILAMLRDDMQRAYRIDIETNSTVEPEAAEDQKNIAELMNAIAQFLNGVTPMIESGVMPFQAAQAMLLAIVRRYRFGADIEDQIKAMQQPKPKDDGKAAAEQAKMQMEKQAHDADMQMKQVEAQQRQAEAQTKAQLDGAKVAADMEKMRLEAEFAREEHAFKMAELRAKTQMTQIVNASKIKVAMATAAAKEKAANQPQTESAQ